MTTAAIVLLLDQDARDRQTIRSVLLSSGYAVLEARNIDEAERLIASESIPIDVLLVAVTSAEESVFTFCDRMLLMLPRLALVLMTDSQSVPLVTRRSRVPCLAKPIGVKTLNQTIRHVLQCVEPRIGAAFDSTSPYGA